MASARRGLAHPPQALRVSEQLGASSRTRAPVELRVLDDDRGARVRHPLGVQVLVAAGRVRIRHEDRGPARRGELEDRRARAGEDEVGGGQRVAQVREVLE